MVGRVAFYCAAHSIDHILLVGVYSECNGIIVFYVDGAEPGDGAKMAAGGNALIRRAQVFFDLAAFRRRFDDDEILRGPFDDTRCLFIGSVFWRHLLLTLPIRLFDYMEKHLPSNLWITINANKHKD